VKTLFLAWQDPTTRRWLPIGRLTYDESTYRFVYTRGAKVAVHECGFRLLEEFSALTEAYESDELFPLFSNRLPSRSRSDYGQFVEWLNVPKDSDDPIALLSKSGGRRMTDFFEVFPHPEPDPEGRYHIHFFAHGLRHLPAESLERINQLRTGEPLLLVHDFQNPYDHLALMLRTNDAFDRDLYIVGYCPRYLVSDVFEILEGCQGLPEVEVERVNLSPAPTQLRLLCSMTGSWPGEFRPCAGEMYQPLAPEPAISDSGR